MNRNNKNAIATYEKCGFVVEKDVEISLPGGFVNYDYVMLYRQKGSDDGKFCMERSENKVIAGVCGGFAEHFKIDPTVVRAVYLLLTLCTAFCGVIVYIVMWILMPEKRKY